MAGTSLPLSKHHFTSEPVESNQWVHISSVRRAREKEYRKRSGAFTKSPASTPIPTKIVKGFTIDDPMQVEMDSEDEGRIIHDPDQCISCQSLQNQLQVCTELNRSLLRKFSRMMQLVDKGKNTVKDIEEQAGLRPRLPEGETNPVFVASQNLCFIDEQDKQDRRESGLDYMSINVDELSRQVKAPSITELSRLSRTLQQTLDECREISVSSASLCLESQFGSLSLSTEGSSPSRKNHRPPLQRMHTLSTATDISTSSMEYSLEVGSLKSTSTNVPQWHSEQKRYSEKVSSLRRTHSENELLTPSVESRVMLLDSGTEERESHETMLPRDFHIPEYARVLSTPGKEKAHPPLSRDQMSHDLAAPFRSYLMSALKYKPSVDSVDSTALQDMNQLEEMEDDPAATKPNIDGEESNHLLEKISTMERHRLSLLEDIEKLKEYNNRLWETIKDLREELDEKDFQLKILCADVQLATKEINGANQQKQEAAILRQENILLSERLRNLEDESKAVKESLVQLVTEKATTNKALAIENQRLRVKMKRSPSTITKDHDFPDGDTFTDEDDFRIKGLIAELDSGEFVHKQGFLTKQGNKRRNWKRRMFVLDNHSLSYYKTEEALGSVPLQEITKVQESHSIMSKYLSHFFEIHRNDPSLKGGERIYYLSAPSHDEMQSWIGIIQTLKETKRQSIRHSTFMDLDSTSPVGSPTDSSIVKARAFTTQQQQGSLTLPPNAERNARQRKTESGVRNRMFTDTGQRRTDITIPLNSSDEEDTTRSPFSVSSDEDHHLQVHDGSHRLSGSKR